MTLRDLVAALVSIESVNPTLVPGAPGERAVADFVSGWLRRHGVNVVEIRSGRPEEDRPSLLCHVPGGGGGRSLVLYAHMDTVGAAGMPDPFMPQVHDGALRGRGAYDMKGSLAAIMRVAAEIAAAPSAGDLWLMIVADEEADSRGAEATLEELARRGVHPDACIVAEPSDLRLMLGHRGFATGVISTHGRAAHTARRDEGVDAIAMMARVIVQLEELDRERQALPAHSLLGHGAVIVSRVSGGSELFTYPAECHADFVWRVLPGETRASLTGQVERIFTTLKTRDERFDARLTWTRWREPMLIDPAAPIVTAVLEAAHATMGRVPESCAAPWWTDGALIQTAGIPVVIYGPSGGGIHAADEWVDLQGLAHLERVLADTTRRFCA